MILNHKPDIRNGSPKLEKQIPTRFVRSRPNEQLSSCPAPWTLQSPIGRFGTSNGQRFIASLGTSNGPRFIASQLPCPAPLHGVRKMTAKTYPDKHPGGCQIQPRAVQRDPNKCPPNFDNRLFECLFLMGCLAFAPFAGKFQILTNLYTGNGPTGHYPDVKTYTHAHGSTPQVRRKSRNCSALETSTQQI